jgi:2-oxoglutarate ferredoxin oxidoreductase subunit alpha
MAQDPPNGTQPAEKPVEQLDEVIIRFAGDSGDGMQLTGSQFTRTTALMGNDFATFPDFPAEIRAPVGTLPGVSAFQLRFSNFDIHTPGNRPHVLVAMNPAALKVHIDQLPNNGLLILNTAKFRPGDLKKAKYETNPLEDGSLDGYRLIQVDLEKLTHETLKESPLDKRSKDRCKNMFALGMLYWLYNRDIEPTMKALQDTFGAKKPDVAAANQQVVKAGYNYADITGLFQTSYVVGKATDLPKGNYRNIMGNQALSLGLVAASKKAKLHLFLGSYPITPASDILHQLSGYKNHGVITFQAEDEIAAVCAAIGASYSGKIGVTATSGPGLALKAEAIGLAVMTELPLVVINVQRSGPSTGMPTKTEQADLLQAMFGRNGESPVPILAPTSPSDAFETAFEAVRIALEYMTPVILLSDGAIANGSEPWMIPNEADLKDIQVNFLPPQTGETEEPFMPYRRNPETLARNWAIPGTEGLQHRIGGIEKADLTGNISYDPANHEHMTMIRENKVAGIANSLPDATTVGPDHGDVLILGWGSTRGPITGAVKALAAEGKKVSGCSLRHINPFPKNLGDLLKQFKRVLIPEMNRGQLAMLIRSKYLVDAASYTKVQGLPFYTDELIDRVKQILEEL